MSCYKLINSFRHRRENKDPISQTKNCSSPETTLQKQNCEFENLKEISDTTEQKCNDIVQLASEASDKLQKLNTTSTTNFTTLENDLQNRSDTLEGLKNAKQNLEAKYNEMLLLSNYSI